MTKRETSLHFAHWECIMFYPSWGIQESTFEAFFSNIRAPGGRVVSGMVVQQQIHLYLRLWWEFSLNVLWILRNIKPLWYHWCSVNGYLWAVNGLLLLDTSLWKRSASKTLKETLPLPESRDKPESVSTQLSCLFQLFLSHVSQQTV